MMPPDLVPGGQPLIDMPVPSLFPLVLASVLLGVAFAILAWQFWQLFSKDDANPLNKDDANPLNFSREDFEAVVNARMKREWLAALEATYKSLPADELKALQSEVLAKNKVGVILSDDEKLLLRLWSEANE